MMHWIGVLESSRQALSINGTIDTEYQCFAQSIQLGRGLESANQRQSDSKYPKFQ